jgi:hypothetical protein
MLVNCSKCGVVLHEVRCCLDCLSLLCASCVLSHSAGRAHRLTQPCNVEDLLNVIIFCFLSQLLPVPEFTIIPKKFFLTKKYHSRQILKRANHFLMMNRLILFILKLNHLRSFNFIWNWIRHWLTSCRIKKWTVNVKWLLTQCWVLTGTGSCYVKKRQVFLISFIILYSTGTYLMIDLRRVYSNSTGTYKSWVPVYQYFFTPVPYTCI